MDRELKRKLAAILVADVVGYSRLIADDEEATLRRLEVFRTLWQDVVTRTGGRIFNTAGDSVLAEFPSVVEAVRCAVEFQAEAKRANDNLVSHRQMQFRIGITIGDVVERGSDLLGDGVNVAARLQTLAGPGGICVSSWVREAVANKLGVKFTDLGDQTVKNIPTPIRAYKVAAVDPNAPMVIGGGSGADPRIGPPMQDWLGRAVSSWRWLAGLGAIMTIGTLAVFYVASQLRAPAQSPATPPPQQVAAPNSQPSTSQPVQSPTPAQPQSRPQPAQPSTTPKQTVAPAPAPSPSPAPTPLSEPAREPGPARKDDPPSKVSIGPASTARPSTTAPSNIAIPRDPDVRRGALTDAVERDLKPGDRFKECDTCPEMVVIPTGDFTMGSQPSDPGHESDEVPAHKVSIATRLAVARYPVTVDEFDTFVTVTGYRPTPGCRIFEGGGWIEKPELSFRNPGFPQTGSHPVVCINWNDAKAYTDWMSARQRSEYRLPSEAEREYATRAGQTTAFWWGNTIEPKLAAYDWTSSFRGSPTATPVKGTQSVAAFAPNPWGLVQVHGNVSEWVEDCWNDNYRGAPADGSPWTAGDCNRRVLRGGSWGYNPKDLRSSYREGATLGFRNFNFGFRVVPVLRPSK